MTRSISPWKQKVLASAAELCSYTVHVCKNHCEGHCEGMCRSICGSYLACIVLREGTSCASGRAGPCIADY